MIFTTKTPRHQERLIFFQGKELALETWSLGGKEKLGFNK